ncbi:unnamed protein product [Tetraodon nigroviridis]|uniref:(spotted green pufferfish) hypothetical protein n=1 Tax=Tetraodon nigroviridis TaxID=99883 RepID=Q4RWD9_TETNG|nr:unnamed protein product [Tetraodon nigroviridis]
MEARSTCSEPSNQPRVLGPTDTAHAASMLTYTHADICAELRLHTGSVVATPAASPPPVRFDSRGRIHHLLGSLGASQLLPRGLTGERSWEALG